MGLIGGLVLGALTYSTMAGLFAIAIGAIIFGGYHLITALIVSRNRTLTSEDGQRIFTYILSLVLGAVLILTGELLAFPQSDDLTYRVVYWVCLIGGYGLVLIGVWDWLTKAHYAFAPAIPK